ncbi:hypothetical protein F2Q69_00014004 [Brassica cretica]|uniref:Pentacotripeptide-repeat region of PRORP domain-containing protein n=1 Tax=Brassica cretica TaxID=69181 RepID=A0A8S9R6X0_BRACR|nr:hypothetical protein F2Q69_00014004 [Brassica cretica]
MELFREISQRGLVGNTITYNTLIQGFCQVGDCDNAQEIFKRMVSCGIPPDIWTYCILLDGFCKNGKLDKALVICKVEAGWDLFCSLSLKGVKPDVVTYNTMILGLCNNKLKHEAYALLRKMKQDGSLLDDRTYNALIRAHLEDGDKAASAEFIKEMRSGGFTGDASTFGLVTNMLQDGRLDKSFLDMLF